MVPHASTLDRRVIVIELNKEKDATLVICDNETDRRLRRGKMMHDDADCTITLTKAKPIQAFSSFLPEMSKALIGHVRVRLDLDESAICKTRPARLTLLDHIEVRPKP